VEKAAKEAQLRPLLSREPIVDEVLGLQVFVNPRKRHCPTVIQRIELIE
jgi:hypothetical protein